MRIPGSVERFLASPRIAVAGVSRDHQQPANAIFHRLLDTGHDVVPVNPRAETLEGVRCYPDVASISGPVDAVMIAAHPDAGLEIVRQCAAKGVRSVWFHRSIGAGSVSDAAVAEARKLGLDTIVGGCPLMYCGKVDPFHRVMCTVLRWRGRAPD
jgi:predicted CoA-binding protein